jgi:hypothetical protein
MRRRAKFFGIYMPVIATKNLTPLEIATHLAEGTHAMSDEETIDPIPEIALAIKDKVKLRSPFEITAGDAREYISLVRKEAIISSFMEKSYKTEPLKLDDRSQPTVTIHSSDGEKLMSFTSNEIWIDEGGYIKFERMVIPSEPIKPAEPKWKPSEEAESDWS